jgi:hypothetical protein
MYRGGFSGVECCIDCLGTVKNDENLFLQDGGHCVQYVTLAIISALICFCPCDVHMFLV